MSELAGDDTELVEAGVFQQLSACARYSKFRRLLEIRLTSQTGDGMFQAGLATLFFFNPQNATTAGGVAIAFAVLLLPFTVVGPFAGPLLDRWKRRNVLIYGNFIRVVLTLILAGILATAPHHAAVYVLALVTLGVNRFLLSALSAGLPHTLPKRLLLIANAITPTLGSIASVIGAALGLLISWIAPAGASNVLALFVAAGLFGSAASLGFGLAALELGPTDRAPVPLSYAFKRTLMDIVAGARYLWGRGTPGYALSIMATHRFLYGANLIALILMSRNLLADPRDVASGLATFSLLAGLSFVGNALAIVLTPVIHRWITPHLWIFCCLMLSALSQSLLVFTYAQAWIAVSAMLLGLGTQGAKIAVDTIIQGDTADSFRGRAFALYDMMYNLAFVGAAALAAAVLPDTGWVAAVFAVMSCAFISAGVLYWQAVKGIGFSPRNVSSAMSE